MSAPAIRYSLAELGDMPTLHVGQYDDLKHDDDGYRVWLSRLGAEDGMPADGMVTVERFDPQTGRWETVTEYVAE